MRAAKGTAGTQAHPAQAGPGKLGHADAGPRLFELAYSCRLYAHFTGYDVSLDRLRELGPELDPYDGAHQAGLFVWLNSWGCRQFAKDQHATIAAISLTRWSSTWLGRLLLAA